MIPALEGGLTLALIRGLAVAALLSAFGTLLFRLLVLPRVEARHPMAATLHPPLHRLAAASLAAAALLLPTWLLLQADDLAQLGPHLGRLPAILPTVLLHTVFGHLWLAQFAAILASRAALPRHPRLALALSAAALALHAGHGHIFSGADGPGLPLAASVLHLLAAGAWLGGLGPLLLAVRHAPPPVAAAAARWFTPLGKWSVAALVLSALLQAWVLLGGLPGLLGTPYGRVVLAKLALLAILLAFAAANRYRLAPALRSASPQQARRTLLRSIAVQTGFGLAATLAAGLLASLPPGLHEQPDWPFPWRPSLAALSEPDLAAEIRTGALLLAAALLCLPLLFWRRLGRPRFLVLAPALLLPVLAWPHLALLLVEAGPTSYYTSPTGFAATSILQGAALYPANCAACHGPAGTGNGLATLPIPPADLTAPHLWEHSDGDLFGWITDGITAPDGTQAMPGFARTLTATQRWALIDAIRALNAGTAQRDHHAWPVPVPLPTFALDCPGHPPTSTEDLGGRILLLSFGTRPPPTPGATPILLTDGQPPPGTDACTATDPATWAAFALLLGRTPTTLAGTQLLVDPHAWLRTVDRPDDHAWSDPARLAAAVARAAIPLTAATGGHHH